VDSNTFLIIAIIAIVAQSFLLFLALFEPGLDYKISHPASCPPDSEEFIRIIEALTDAQVTRRSSIEVFTNGENYYEAELYAAHTKKWILTRIGHRACPRSTRIRTSPES